MERESNSNKNKVKLIHFDIILDFGLYHDTT